MVITLKMFNWKGGGFFVAKSNVAKGFVFATWNHGQILSPWLIELTVLLSLSTLRILGTTLFPYLEIYCAIPKGLTFGY